MKLLYIEDNRFDADLTVRELARRAPHIQVQLAATLTEARALLTKDCPYDLVLSDLHLIEGSGLQLLNDIRGQRLPLAVVIITGFGDEESAIAALKAGADDYIVKQEGYLQRLPRTLETALARFRSESTRISQPLRVLYAEQNIRDVVLTQKHIGRFAQHIQLEIVASPERVIEALTDPEGAGWDILLLDYHLSGHNALELMKILLQDHHVDLPVVVVTDQGNEETAAQALRLGVYGYVVKHQDYLIELPSVLESAFNRYQLKQEKKALKVSEEKYRLLAETALDFILTHDLEGRITFANQAAVHYSGYESDVLLTKNITDFVPQDELKQLTQRKQLRKRGSSERRLYETVFSNKHGDLIPVEVSSSAIIQQDQIKGILLVARDISERRRAEQATRESEEKYRTLFETMTQGVIYVSAEGRITSANRSASELLKLPLDRIQDGKLCQTGLEAVQEDGTPLPPGEYPSMVALKTGKIVENMIMGLQDADTGLIRWLLVNAVPQFKSGEPKPYQVYVTSEDITDRIRSETRIRHLNRVLLAIREINHLIVHERDAETLIQKACDILTKHRGYNSVLIILTDESGAPTVWAEAGWGDRFPAMVELLENGVLPPCCLQTGTSCGVKIFETEDSMCRICPFGQENEHLAAMCCSLEHGDQTFGYLSVSIDQDLGVEEEEISIFRETANDLSFGLTNIAQSEAVARAEKARKDMEIELRQVQKMDAIGRLAGGVAHDFNNMLSVISGYANLALMRLDPGDPLYQNLLEIDQAAMRSARLTRQLLAFSRKQEIEPVAVNLNEIVNNQLKMLRRLIGEDIEVNFIPTDGLWPVMIDLSQIDQILTNLAVNSRDAINGVGVISIQVKNVAFRAMEASPFLKIQPGEYVLLSFSDTGKGIDKETLEHIFEPFYTTKGEGKGTGLGLSTVYGIVKQNNGAIHVYSEPGMGTTLNIYLPRFEGDLGPKTKTEVYRDEPGTETILLVEDDDLVLNLTKSILTRKGYHVLAAGMPGEALELVKNHDGPIHLVLTDVIMPTMNGRQLKDKLEALRPGIKTLFMSGYTADIISRHGVMETGINFINKPFTLESLSSKVREILDE